jgi:transposase
MNKRYLVKLDKQERKELSQLVKKERIAAKKRTHAQVLLLADAGKQGPAWKDEAIAEACQVTVQTVENIRKRLVLEGLELALNRKKQVRPSRAKILDGEKEAKVIALCCGAVPSGHARWTLRLLAERVVELDIVEAVSHETVRRCLKKTSLSPGRKACGVFLRSTMPSLSTTWKTCWRPTNAHTIRVSR